MPPLVLAGRKGWKLEELLQSISAEVKDKIIFTGFIDDVDLPYVYAMSSLFIFPSKYEGFGMPPLEALACGTKVLSSDSSSLPEVLGEEVTYFKSDDLNSLKKQLFDYSIKLNISNFNQTFQVKKYIWENEGNKLIKHLEKSL